jgi:tight adherence protein B
MTGFLISGFVFLAVFLGIFAINLVLTDIFKEERSEQLKELEAELRLQMRQHAKSVTQNESLQSISVSAKSRNTFSIVQLIKRFKKAVDQAGLNTDPQKIGFYGLAGGAIVAVLLYFFTNSLLLALLVMLVGALSPIAYILQKRKQRLAEMGEQLPEALELMSRVMRAGQTVTQAMNAVADEFSDPVGTEFGFCYEQQNLGLSLEVALHNLVERTGLMEIKIMVMGMIIQRQAGGNLAELLDKLSGVMRQRLELRGLIQTLTAEGRMQAWFLVFLPFGAWLALLGVNRGYALKLLDHPTLIYSTLGMMLFGMLWIRKIINFDY